MSYTTAWDEFTFQDSLNSGLALGTLPSPTKQTEVNVKPVAELDPIDLLNYTPGYEAYALAFGAEGGPWTVNPAELGLTGQPAANLQLAVATYDLPHLVLPPVNPAALGSFDSGLASPLGLGSASQFDYADFDESEEMPPLDLDDPEINHDDNSTPPTPLAQATIPTLGDFTFTVPPTRLRPNPPPPTRTPAAPSPAPATATRSSRTKPPPVATRTPLPTTSASRPHATGFRGAATKLVALDAPIGHRTYKTDSATSKKRKTTQTVRALAKRTKSATPAPAAPSSREEDAADVVKAEAEDDEDIPDDLLSAEERKRRQNTLSARKSRQRKQERLGLLEEENVLLKAEMDEERRAHEETRRRLDEAVAMLRGLGLA